MSKYHEERIDDKDYHSESTLALQGLLDDLQDVATRTGQAKDQYAQNDAQSAFAHLQDGLGKLIAQGRQSLTVEPAPYPAAPTAVAPAVKPAIVNGRVSADFANVYETPHANAQVTGKIGVGAVLPITAEASTDGGDKWWKIVDGKRKGGYVKASDLTLQS